MSTQMLPRLSTVPAAAVAALKVEFDDPADWQWALDMWRSLRPA